VQSSRVLSAANRLTHRCRGPHHRLVGAIRVQAEPEGATTLLLCDACGEWRRLATWDVDVLTTFVPEFLAEHWPCVTRIPPEERPLRLV